VWRGGPNSTPGTISPGESGKPGVPDEFRISRFICVLSVRTGLDPPKNHPKSHPGPSPAQRRLWEVLGELGEGLEELWESSGRLWESLWEGLEELWESFGRLYI